MKSLEWRFLIVIIILGFLLRFVWFIRTLYFGQPLVPDAQEYMDIGENLLKGFYPWPREPFFPLIVAFTFLLFSPSALVLRLLTLFLSIVVIYLSYSLARVCFKGSWECLLPPFLVATNFYLIFNSVRGLREELYSILILLILILTIKLKNNGFTSLKYLAIGILSSMIYFTRSEGLLILILLMIFQIWYGSSRQNKTDFKFIVVVFISSILAIITWAFACIIIFNNPFPISELNGSWLYKTEFGEIVKISFLDYIFLYHSPLRLLNMIFIGVMNSISMVSNFLTPFGLSKIPIGLTMLLLGLIFSLRQEKLFVLHLALFGGILPYMLHFSLNSQFRLIYSFLPLMFLFIAYTIFYLKEYAPSRTYTFKIFSNRRISITIYGLSFLAIIPIILTNMVKFVDNLVIWRLFWESTYDKAQAIFAIDMLILTLAVLFMVYMKQH